MATPLYISQCLRRSGVTKLTVVGHGLTRADVNRPITVAGCPDNSVNVTSTISRVSGTDGIEFLQPGKTDIPAALVGGAVAIG